MKLFILIILIIILPDANYSSEMVEITVDKFFMVANPDPYSTPKKETERHFLYR
tara:strand:- start:106 stop:267 length:162 start_codon:yes stop_codon:yes gene_type:complete